MPAFTDADIRELLSGTGSRGLNLRTLKEFIVSGDKMQKVDLSGFSKKDGTPMDAAQVKQGITAAKNSRNVDKAASDAVVAKVVDDELYLINTALVGPEDEDVQEILNSGGQRGVYLRELTNFVASGEKAREVVVSAFLKKDGTPAEPASVKQGFDNAKSSRNAPAEAQKVSVVKRERDGTERVFLINTALVPMA